MIRDHLRDAAVATAKTWSHETVEPRHIAYAIARHFEDQEDIAAYLPRAKRALEPRGSAIGVPGLAADSVELLDSIVSPQDAHDALARVLDAEAGADEDDEEDEVAPIGTRSADGESGATLSVGAEHAGKTEPVETVADVLSELDHLVGLQSVKRRVREVIAVVQANRERSNAGLATVNPGMHLVFTGPPGTGKTTVARLIARLYAASGALPGAKFIEVDRSRLVAGYVGQTAEKTAEVVRQTIPGVLFVDEAYSLTPSHASDFGAEALATLVKAMEDRRHELALIFAGYGEEMEGLLDSNPGLRSRFKTFIEFPKFDSDELTQIFTNFVDAAGLRLADDAIKKAADLFERGANRSDFGNARFARSLFEEAYARMALRAAEDGEMHMNELVELCPEDLAWSDPGGGEDGRIGFVDRRSAAEDKGPR